VPQKETFLSDSLVAVYNSLFDNAEKAVAKSPELLGRVKTARMPVHYAMLEIARAEMTGKRGAFTVAAGNTLIAKPEIINLLYEFVYTCIRNNVSHVRERRITPQEYLEGYTKFLEENKGMVLGQNTGK
jgi:hypothetical protein